MEEKGRLTYPMEHGRILESVMKTSCLSLFRAHGGHRFDGGRAPGGRQAGEQGDA